MAYNPALHDLIKYRTELINAISEDASDDAWTTAQQNHLVNRAIRYLWRWLVKIDPTFHIQRTEAYTLLPSDVEEIIRLTLSDVFTGIGLEGQHGPYAHKLDWWIEGDSTLLVRNIENVSNLLVNARDHSQDDWTATDGTVGTEAVSCPDKTVRTTNLFTASGNDGTLLQALTLDDDYYAFGVYLRRKTGTGTVSVTADGSTYTAVTLTSTAWARTVVTYSGTAINAGIKLGTSGDAVYIDGAFLGVPDLALFEYLTFPDTLTNDTDADVLPDELKDWVVPVAYALAQYRETEKPGADLLEVQTACKAFIDQEFPRNVGYPVRHAEIDLGSYDGFGA
jgi:hypothetical protein